MRRIFICAAAVVCILSVAVVRAEAQSNWTRVKLLTCPRIMKATASVTVKSSSGNPLGTVEITCGDRKHTFKTGKRPRLWEATVTVTNTQTGSTETCKFSGRFKAGVRCGSPSVGLVLEKPRKKSLQQSHFPSNSRIGSERSGQQFSVDGVSLRRVE